MESSGSAAGNHLSVAALYSDTKEETEMIEIDQNSLPFQVQKMTYKYIQHIVYRYTYS